MDGNPALIHEKLEQAAGILREQHVDLWLTLVRETLLTKDPCLDLIAGTYCAWQSAFLVGAGGERIAIVGRFDAPGLEQMGAYGEVVGYDESIRPALREAVERLDPGSIALNYSGSDPAADGLTHGLWLELQETLAGTPYPERLVSSEHVVNAVRGRKSPQEVALVRAAAATTEEIFERVTESLRPGLAEVEIAGLMHEEVAARGLGYAWGRDHCPAVNAGPDKVIGHAPPGALTIERGQLLHVDFGVRQDGYCSDLQRVWYFLDDGETEPPADVLAAWSDALGLRRRGRRRPTIPRRSAGRWTMQRGARSSTPATPSRSTRSATSSGARRTTAARCSGRVGTATALPRSGRSRRATSSRSSTASTCPTAATSASRRTCS